MVLEVIEIWHWALTHFLPPASNTHITLNTVVHLFYVTNVWVGFFCCCCLTAVLYHHDSPGDKLYCVGFIFPWLKPMPEHSFHGFHGEGTTHTMVWDFIHFVVQSQASLSLRCKRPQHQMWNVRKVCHINKVCPRGTDLKQLLLVNVELWGLPPVHWDVWKSLYALVCMCVRRLSFMQKRIVISIEMFVYYKDLIVPFMAKQSQTLCISEEPLWLQ